MSEAQPLAGRLASSLLSRVVRGIAANMLGQLLGLTSRLILVPLFVTSWGVETYGDWLLLTSMVAYLTVADLGAQLYIVNRATQEYARGDLTAFRRIVQSGMLLFLCLPAVVLVAFSLFVLFVHPQDLVGARHTSRLDATLVLIFMAFQLLLTLPHGLLLGIYRAVGMLPTGAMLANVALVIQLFGTAATLRLGMAMPVVAAVQALPFVIVGVYAFYDLSRRFPDLDLGSLAEARMSVIREFTRPSLHFLFIQLSYALSLQGVTMVVGLIFGSAQLVLFSTLRTMINAMKQVLAMVAHSAWPEMTRLDATNSRENLLILFRGLLRSTMVASILFAGVLHFFGEFIYSTWLRNSVEFRQDLLDVFLVYVVQAVFWTACSNLLMAVNAHQKVSHTLIVSSALSVALAAVGGRLDGLPGAILGMAAADLVLPFWFVPYLLARYERRFSAQFFVEEGAPAAAALGCLLLVPRVFPAVAVLLLLWWLQCLPLNTRRRLWKYGR